MLTRETFVGPWAGLPVAWDKFLDFDENAYREAVSLCCEAGIPGVYTGGTTGEFYALELEEFKAVARATIEECHAHGKPAMIGCTATSTRGASLRAMLAADMGADALQLALPFWMEVADAAVVPFFHEVSAAGDNLPLSIYETLRSKKALSLEMHQAIKETLPNYTMVKANAGTVGCTPEGCRALSEFVNVFVSEHQWAELGPCGACGSCSAMVYWNPRIILRLWDLLRAAQWESVNEALKPILELFQFLIEHFGAKGFTDTAYDRMGGRMAGFLPVSLRSCGPYRGATQQDLEELRAWCLSHYPEMLEL